MTGFINSSGRLIVPLQFETSRGFQEGMCAVWQGGKWGFINLQGVVIIAPTFEDVSDFSDGLAAVKTEGKWGYITPCGAAGFE